jgi:hypothetical protein
MPKFAHAMLVFPASLFALSTPGVAQVNQPAPRENEERRICRSMEVTGKLAARRRICMTRAGWERLAEDERRSAQSFVSALDSCQRFRADNDGQEIIGGSC